MNKMRKLFFTLGICLAASLVLASTTKSELMKGFVNGNPEIKSINALAFGPEGILFVGDSKQASVFAIDTKDDTEQPESENVAMKKVDEAIANAFGTTVDNITIQDMAVNPMSKTLYFAVHHTNGTPALVKLVGESFQQVDLTKIDYSSAEISNAVAEDAKDRRGRSQRVWAISDLGYSNGKVMVTGLSNKEFSSTFRSMDFPFKGKEAQSSLEIYHAAHGQYETFAPVKTFTATEIKGEPHIIASYTCTPLVLFPMNELKPGEHSKGRTIAELGNWNTPLDMITMEKEGKKFLLLANSSRAVMKLSYEDIASFQESLTSRVKERSGTAGVDFIALPFVNVTQMDKLDNSKFVMLQRKPNGNLDLITQSSRWL